MKFVIGDYVKVINEFNPHYGHTGLITNFNEHNTAHKRYKDYTYKCDICGKTRNFRASFLEKI